MKVIRVLLDYTGLSVAELIEFARNTVIKMTGNASFATPLVLLSLISTALNDLETKYNSALNGGSLQKADLRQSLRTLLALLRKQALYVDGVCGGNESMILSSGFHTTGQPSPKRLPEFSLKNGENSGEVLAKHKAVKGAKSWVWQRVSDPLPTNDSSWAYVGFTTSCKFTDSGLVPAGKYWYRVAWITKDGISAWSNPLMIIVK